MKNKGNIHDVIRARELAKKLIDVDPNNKGQSLQVPNLVLIGFNKYLNTDNDGNLIPIVMTNEYIEKMVLEFTHSSMEIPFKSAYMVGALEEDLFLDSFSNSLEKILSSEKEVDYFSPNSFYDSLTRILSSEKEVADCLGFVSVDKFLLEAKGIESRIISYGDHVALEAKNNGEFVFLETTLPRGYGYKSLRKRLNDVALTSIILSNLACGYSKEEDYVKAIDACTKSIKISPRNEVAYHNRAGYFSKLKRFEDAILGYTKAIELNSEFEDAYFTRAIRLKAFGRYDGALADYKKYASFSKDNAKEVKYAIEYLEKKLREVSQIKES